ncbi:DUF835 domain-containing protein [Thermococcus barossii]|uniref:DUF835 domain-containing protein n=1 Tax=Thermococcus barossii TaxID=54077 RepID=A0A2Z2MFC3_9EURY|nr:DUF835 domain-containing protein [Thermococcus barossii]ASJ04616.1 hypothetical protein A3L01_04235 [Thermococcus barossii]
MDGIHALVFVEAVMVLIADLVAAGWIFRIYLRNRRKSALAFSLAWIFDFLAILLTTIANPTAQLMGVLLLPAFSGLIFYGAVKFLEEESIAVRYRTLSALAIMPVAFMIYMVGVYLYTGDAVWTITSAATLGITGVFVIAGGLLLKETEEIYKSAVKYLYISIILFGLHLIPAALFGIEEWYKAVGFTLSTILIVSMVVAMVKLTSSESFTPRRGRTAAPVDLKPGVVIVNGKEYQKLKEKLKDRPVLAFVRDVTQVPEGWQYYFVTTIPFQGRFKNTINPTNLARMTELSYKYLEEFAKMGGQGIIVIDCLEYLTVYNSWESLMKFLSKLRDFVIINKGTLILVIEKESLENRLYAQLRKLME